MTPIDYIAIAIIALYAAVFLWPRQSKTVIASLVLALMLAIELLIWGASMLMQAFVWALLLVLELLFERAPYWIVHGTSVLFWRALDALSSGVSRLFKLGR